MDKYKKLFSNTIVFAIGTFSSKILTILLMPFLTRALNTAQYGEMDIIQQTVNVLVPVATMAVNSAALRFAMDKAEDKRSVFSTGVFTTGIGFGIFLLFTPLLAGLELKDVKLGNYIIIISVFLLSSSTRQLCQQFVRGMGWVRLYAIDGILATFTNLVCTFLYLGVFHWDVNGAVMAIATSDIISILFLTVFGRLDRFIKPKRLRWNMSRSMLKYSIPLVPTAILWLIINISDRYMVAYFLGAGANGLYAAASKIPNFVLLFAGIFIDAWQLSAVDEYDSDSRGHFFTKIFRIYSGALFAVASVLILSCQLFTRILVSKEFNPSWEYVPTLILSTVFSCLVNFLASVYMAEKKNTMSMVTALAGAVLNVGMNLWLIPQIGVNGAAISTVCSFVLVFILRAVDTRRFVKIHFSVGQMVFNTVFLAGQAAVMIFLGKDGTHNALLYGIEAGMTLVMVIINGKPLLEIAGLLIGKFLKKKPSLPKQKEKRKETPDSLADRKGFSYSPGDRDNLEAPSRYNRKGDRTKYQEPAYEPLSETIESGADYFGLGFPLDDLPESEIPDAEQPYQIKYTDAFIGEQAPFTFHEEAEIEPPVPHGQYERKVKEYTDSDDDSYFGEESKGFIRRKPGRGVPPGYQEKR